MADTQDLAAIHRALWQQLEAAAQDKAHGWRTCVLATVEDGLPAARTVILREAEAPTGLLRLYTDARSTKVRQIEAQPRGCLVLWCGALRWQLRLTVRLAVDRDGLSVSSRWARLQLTPAARDYLAPVPPGAVLEAPATAPADTTIGPIEPARNSRSHFAVLHAQVLEIDWLELGAVHRRAAWTGDEPGRWLQP